MKSVCIHIIVMLTLSLTYGQEKYVVTFEELPEKMAASPKPILIKIYTDWCAVCKIQDKKIEKDTALQELLKNNCYLLELNAETTETIVFNNKKYSYIPQGASNGYHELSTYLTENTSAYPYWVLLSPEYEILGTYSGLLKNNQLKELLKNQQ